MIIELHTNANIMFNDWWYDFGAIIHVYNSKNHLKDYKVAQDGQKVLMGNYNVAKMMKK